MNPHSNLDAVIGLFLLVALFFVAGIWFQHWEDKQYRSRRPKPGHLSEADRNRIKIREENMRRIRKSWFREPR